ncbi:cytochrome c-type biogenesis protein [Nitrospirillum amazonense]|uniref:cytochrome c-type biogenesis protein n=1 Tax=Nitrospirillum amazonense TaxID=28077 RepID=UPI0024121D79|nr:cytochrome c-type biogenesis protein [Nitrospirillum amazonense]MDG3440169.1 cytochrome c-type biogenesis protein CcmH [Nitrospirillum amazonense]
MRRVLFTLVLAATLLSGPLARAVQPDEMLSDPAMEARARAISKDLRCLVCQNQSIDDSDAPLARDLRLLLRERLVKGDTDAQAVAFLTDRYGDYVLLRPPVRPATYLLWFGPFALLVVGGGILLWRGRRGPVGAEAVAPPLTAEEKAHLAMLMRDEDEGKGRP